jgi:hypothetical protein
VFTSRYQRGQVFRAVMAHMATAIISPTTRRSTGWRRGPGGVPLRDPGGRRDAGGQPQRQRPRDRRDLSPNLRVLGLMPHAEDLVDPLMGGTDGKPLFDSLAAA